MDDFFYKINRKSFKRLLNYKAFLLILSAVLSVFSQTITPIKFTDTNEKIIAYTLDDGPSADVTPKLLDLFAQENVKFTFFNLGKNLVNNIEIAQRVIDEGHEIGNHTYHHLNLPELEDSAQIYSEIFSVRQLIQRELDYTPKLFRAPYLKYDERVLNVLNELELKLISAKVFTGDAAISGVEPDSIVKKVLNKVTPGAIILGHERTHTYEALKKIIPALKSRGYKFVTVSELLRIKGSRKRIPADDKNIHIHGAKFSKYSEEMVDLQRHSDSLLALPANKSLINPLKAKTTSGIVISFITNSNDIKVYFKMLPGEQRNGLFAVYQDGRLSGTQELSATDDSSITVNIQAFNPDSETRYKITLPTWNNLAFCGMETDAMSDLFEEQAQEKKIYAAYGNSITHGTGQKGTNETYAYQIAEKFGWELYNVAVGGGKTSKALAQMLGGAFEHIDYITILIGYNDYNSSGIDTIEYKERYNAVLNSIREKHPFTEIFCITQTYTRQDTSKSSGLPIDDFRKALANLVKEKQCLGDGYLYLIRGEQITSAANLKDPAVSKDPVHFTAEGAALFADSLAAKISEILDLPTRVNDKSEGEIDASGATAPLFHLYPNPNYGILKINSTCNINNIKIYNILGQKVKTVSDNTNRINLAGLSKGIYFMQISDIRGNSQIRKLILK
jgi:peptidoglycan/xylan/chitin deacetylase (PgdA/CDA1 family)/lysophospholipase L1-like esterase